MWMVNIYNYQVGNMIPYGQRKRGAKLHPHNECDICNEKEISPKGSERLRAKQEILKEIEEDKDDKNIP